MGWVGKATPLSLYPQERPGTNCIEGWAVSGASGPVRIISPPSGFDPRTVQPVVSRDTDYAIPAQDDLQYT